jgi:hypothetical protein
MLRRATRYLACSFQAPSVRARMQVLASPLQLCLRPWEVTVVTHKCRDVRQSSRTSHHLILVLPQQTTMKQRDPCDGGATTSRLQVAIPQPAKPQVWPPSAAPQQQDSRLAPIAFATEHDVPFSQGQQAPSGTSRHRKLPNSRSLARGLRSPELQLARLVSRRRRSTSPAG